MIDFIVRGLDDKTFAHLFDLDHAAQQAQGIRILTADNPTGFPCRVSLANAQVGDTVALLAHPYHEVPSPYRASGPIFVRRGATTAQLQPNEIPEVMRNRLLSFRAYDEDSLMVTCEVTPGAEAVEVIQRLFAEPGAKYIHVHNARPGCYSCQIDRLDR
jgi:hypothetical protein